MTTNPTSDNLDPSGLPIDRPRLLLDLPTVNRYGGDCRVCGYIVGPGEGRLARRSTPGPTGSVWEVQHTALADCRTAAAEARERYVRPLTAAEATADADTPYATSRLVPERGAVYVLPAAPARHGAVQLDDDSWVSFYRVSHRRNGQGWYVNLWAGSEWIYARAARQIIVPAHEATAEHAAAFGAAFSRCVFCTRELDTAESITVGYGPVCADQRGLPWGSVSAAEASAARQRRNTTVRVGSYTRPAPACDPHECPECGEEFATIAEAAHEAHPCVV